MADAIDRAIGDALAVKVQMLEVRASLPPLGRPASFTFPNDITDAEAYHLLMAVVVHIAKARVDA